MTRIRRLTCSVALVLLAVSLGAAEKAGPNWNEFEHVFTGKLDQVVSGPVGQSFPPLYTHTLHFTVETVLRGGLKAGAKAVCSHAARQHNEPVFPQGKVCLVAARVAQGGMRVAVVQEADAGAVAAATAACSLPLGWKVEDGKSVSPWAVLGKAAWPAGLGARVKVACKQTGRPALMAGPDVTLAVEPVPPAQEIQWTNPDGDGEYKITVTNATDQSVSVPALLSDGQNILWEESLVILCQGKAYLCPGCTGVSSRVQSAQIPAGGSVSTVVNALRLDGPEWPRGGYRIEFQFCLGEKSQTKSFYYMSRHHDKLRNAAKADGAKPAPAPATKPPAGEPPAAGETSKVTGTFVIPGEVASFEGRVVEILLFKIHPQLADKGADLVEKVEIKDFAHKQGTETKQEFVIGTKAKLEKELKYYITLFILKDGERTHMGAVAGKFLCTVLTQGEPNNVTLTVTQVR